VPEPGYRTVDPAANTRKEWDHPAITTIDFDEFSVRTEDFRYIRYIDGGEELYDHRTDAEEWTNLANHPEYAAIKAKMIGHNPVNPAPLGPTIELEPHHTPPFGSAEQYEAYIKATESVERYAQFRNLVHLSGLLSEQLCGTNLISSLQPAALA